jgi:multidrug efflux system outer membrane protein
VAIAVGFAGCTAVGPTYKRPDVTPEPQFRSQIGASEAQSLADLPWWEVFNDPALKSLITQALNESYDLQVAMARISQARALVGVARSELYPQVGYDVIAGREKTFFPLQLGDQEGNLTFNTFGLGASSMWELDLWGRVRRSTEAAQANLYQQEDVRRGVMLSLVSDVATAYFRLLELDRQLAIATESSNAFQQTADLFGRRFQGGQDSRLAVVRGTAAHNASLARIAELNRLIAQQENAISVLLGNYPRTIPRGTALAQQVTPPTPLGQTTEIVHRRPDIQQAEHAIMMANAEVGVAVANYFPRIGLSALFGQQSPDIDTLFDSDFNVWRIAGGLSGPIYQGGALRGNVDARKAAWDASVSQYKRTVVGAFREVSDALIAQQTLATQRAAQENQVRSLRDAVDLASTRYNVGRATYFEVLQAQQLLFPSEEALAQTQREQLVAVVNLYKALGGGWNLNEAEWPHPK